jgi:hypothetical protein
VAHFYGGKLAQFYSVANTAFSSVAFLTPLAVLDESGCLDRNYTAQRTDITVVMSNNRTAASRLAVAVLIDVHLRGLRCRLASNYNCEAIGSSVVRK